MNSPHTGDIQDDLMRVLVVDDNRDAAESLCQLLEFMACQTVVAFDGASGVAACDRFNPQLAFIDLDMPGMDGCEVVRQLRLHETTPPRQLICLTGRHEAQAEIRCLGAGFDQFITKPIDTDRLMKALEKAKRH